jgi:hypothetical protein
MVSIMSKTLYELLKCYSELLSRLPDSAMETPLISSSYERLLMYTDWAFFNDGYKFVLQLAKKSQFETRLDKMPKLFILPPSILETEDGRRIGAAAQVSILRTSHGNPVILLHRSDKSPYLMIHEGAESAYRLLADYPGFDKNGAAGEFFGDYATFRLTGDIHQYPKQVPQSYHEASRLIQRFDKEVKGGRISLETTDNFLVALLDFHRRMRQNGSLEDLFDKFLMENKISSSNKS